MAGALTGALAGAGADALAGVALGLGVAAKVTCSKQHGMVTCRMLPSAGGESAREAGAGLARSARASTPTHRPP